MGGPATLMPGSGKGAPSSRQRAVISAIGLRPSQDALQLAGDVYGRQAQEPGAGLAMTTSARSREPGGRFPTAWLSRLAM